MDESEVMKRHLEHSPIAIIQDRYGGAYSGGAWLAVSQARLKHKGKRRAAYVLRMENAGPHR